MTEFDYNKLDDEHKREVLETKIQSYVEGKDEVPGTARFSMFSHYYSRRKELPLGLLELIASIIGDYEAEQAKLMEAKKKEAEKEAKKRKLQAEIHKLDNEGKSRFIIGVDQGCSMDAVAHFVSDAMEALPPIE